MKTFSWLACPLLILLGCDAKNREYAATTPADAPDVGDPSGTSAGSHSSSPTASVGAVNDAAVAASATTPASRPSSGADAAASESSAPVDAASPPPRDPDAALTNEDTGSPDETSDAQLGTLDSSIPTCEPEPCTTPPTRCGDPQTGEVCAGATPACVNAQCVACTEHAECPESACHLAGAERGRCFDPATVVDVQTVVGLHAAIDAVPDGGQAVIRLAAVTYTLGDQIDLNRGREIAFLGTPGTTIRRTAGMHELFYVNNDAIIYFSQLTFEDVFGYDIAVPWDGIMWLDDSSLQGNDSQALVGGGKAVVRRSVLRNIEWGEGSLVVQNTAVYGSSPAVRLNSRVVADFRYVTVFSEETAWTCLAGDPAATTTIRNSILVGDVDDSLCPNVDFSNTVLAPASKSTWFENPTAYLANVADLHLSASGESELEDLAEWQASDPTADIDGDARPQTAAGYPGYDEP